MKVALGFFLGVLCAVSAFAQGTIHFANTATTTLSTNSTSSPPPGQAPNATGLTSGLNHYRIGLYLAPSGTSDESAFFLFATATNGGIAGRFDGGLVTPPNTGEPFAFQVRAWTLTGGSTFEQASGALGFPYLGKSTIGSVLPIVGGAEIFGVGPGQVGGFILTPSIPEPSGTVLFVLGALVGIGCWRGSFRRRKV